MPELDPLRIMVLGTRGFPHVQGGVESHCEQLYPRLVRLGCEVTAFTRTPYLRKRKKEWQGVKFINLWCPRSKSLEAILHTLWGMIRAKLKRPDILHVHAIGPSLVVPFAKLLRIKVVVTNHGPDYERQKWGKLAKYMLRLGENWGTRFADRVIVISELIKTTLTRNYGREDIHIIPNGVTIPEIIRPGETLKKYSLEPLKYILAVGRFVPEKGFHDLIQAFTSLESKGIKLVLAGDADHETVYSRNLKKMAAANANIVLPGFITGKALAELYSNTRLFVLPSYYEGLPIALLEALSFRLPVLVSDIPANKEVSLPAQRYFRVGDRKDLETKLRVFIRQEISEEEKARQLALLINKYNWENIAEKTYDVYRSIILNPE